MSTASNSANSHSNFFETAEVRLVTRWSWSQSDYKLAYVIVSSRIYWILANEDETNKPQSFEDFQNTYSLELVRLENGTWDDVDDCVEVNEHNGTRSIMVCGRPHGRTRRNNAMIGRNVRVEIKLNAPQQIQVWFNQIRARIVPWSLLEQKVKDVVRGASSSGLKELKDALGVLTVSCVTTEPSSMSTDGKEGKWSNLSEEMEKLSIVDKLNAHGATAFVSAASLATLVARVECVAETAKLIGDLSKFIRGLSSIFQLLALGAQGVSMYAKARYGRRMLPIALGRTGILLEYVLESMTEIMKPSQDLNEVDIDFVFGALRQTVSTIDLIATQLLRGRGSQIINSEDVKEAEKKLEDLIHRVVTAGAISKISTITGIVKNLQKEHEISNGGLYHVWPSLSAFFSGRTKELNSLRDILLKRGSAVITQYGGVGKTELIIALADRAERNNREPRDVFWVTVDGGKKDVIESLAVLAEKLIQRKMDEDERRNPNLVVAALKQGLDIRKGR